MQGFRFPPQIAWPLAVILAFAALWISYSVLAVPLWLSGLIGVLVFVALYLILDPRSTKEVATDTYTTEARGQVQRTLAQLRTLTRQAQALPANPVTPRLLEVNRLTEALLVEVQEKRPNELLSAAQAVDYRVQKLGEALNVYEDLLRDPRAARLSRSGEIGDRLTGKTLPALEQWLNNNLDRLHAGDIMQLEVAMNQLEASQYEALK